LDPQQEFQFIFLNEMIPFASRQIVAMILCHAEIPLTPNPIMLMRGMLSFGDGLMSFWGLM